MCGRYQIDADNKTIGQYYGKSYTASFKAHYNIAPSQQMPIVTEDHIEEKKWGLPLTFGEKIFKKLINVRDDSLQKPWAKRFLQTGRCLIPATGFYEWKQTKDHKIPYYVGLPGHNLFSFAGICDEEGYAIITPGANKQMKEVHDRMPAILTDEESKQWINPDITEPEHLRAYIHPYTKKLEIYPISPVINNPRISDKSVFRQVSS